MPTPKQRHTKSRQGKRRSHLALKKRFISSCSKCHEPIMPHRVCLNCGVYAGRDVIDVFKKLTKKERKQKEKEMKAHEKEHSHEAKKMDMGELSKKI